MIRTSTPSYSILIRFESLSKPGILGKVASAIGKGGENIGAVNIPEIMPEEASRYVRVIATGRSDYPN